MKLTIINDVHIGRPDTGFEKGVQHKLTNQSESIFKEVIGQLNQDRPEFVVNLGDSIEDINNHDQDLRLFRHFLALASTIKAPVYHLAGNHDLRTLTETEIASLLNREKMHYSFDHGGWHFVALSFILTGKHQTIKEDISASIPAGQINWLKNDLAAAAGPAIIFSHYGLAEDDMQGNFWFEKQPHYARLDNRAEVKQILEQSGKVKAVFNAHQHWNRMHIENNIPYFTVTSMTENFNNNGVPTKAYTIVNLNPDKINVDVQGNDPAQWEYKL